MFVVKTRSESAEFKTTFNAVLAMRSQSALKGVLCDLSSSPCVYLPLWTEKFSEGGEDKEHVPYSALNNDLHLVGVQ